MRVRPSLRSRATSLLLALAANLLLILLLIGLNVSRPERPQFKGGPTLITLTESHGSSPAAAKVASQPRLRPPVPKPAVRPPPMPTRNPLPLLVLSKDEMEAADISRLGTRGSPVAGAQVASTAGDSQAVGTAPDGQPLYSAEWYREPTDTELGAYLPKQMPSEGWGLIACKTAPRFRVEDCVELGNSPPGSHLAGAVRQAAWQFLVRPPRVGGRDLIGSWVRIRIDYRPAARD